MRGLILVLLGAAVGGCSIPCKSPASNTSGVKTVLVWGESTDSDMRRVVIDEMKRVRGGYEKNTTVVVHTGNRVSQVALESCWSQFCKDTESVNLASYGVVGDSETSGHSRLGSSENRKLFFGTETVDTETVDTETVDTEHLRTRKFGHYDWVFLDEDFDLHDVSTLEEKLNPSVNAKSNGIILVTHRPLRTSVDGRYCDAKAMRALRALITRTLSTPNHPLRLVLSGHARIYERYMVQGVPFINTGGGGADLDETRACEPDDSECSPPVVIRRTHHYVRLDFADKSKIKITMHEWQPDNERWELADHVDATASTITASNSRSGVAEPPEKKARVGRPPVVRRPQPSRRRPPETEAFSHSGRD